MTDFEKAAAALQSPNPDERLTAIDKLSRLGEPAGAPLLIRATRDINARVREAAAWALGDIGDAEATEPLTQLAQRTRFPHGLRWAALHSLGMIGDGDGLAVLFEVYYRDDSLELRQTAARGILRYGDSAAPALIAVLEDETARPEARAAAAQMLGRLKVTNAVPALLNAVNEVGSTLRWDAVKALGDIASPKAVPRLIDLLGEDDVFLGKVAAWALESISTPEAIEAARRWRDMNVFGESDDDIEP